MFDTVKYNFMIFAACLLASCSLFGQNNEELIQDIIIKWKTAVENNDIEAIMECYSDQMGDAKKDVRIWMEGAIEKGTFDEVTVSIKQAEISFEDQHAEFGPVEFLSEDDVSELAFILIKDGDGIWRIFETESDYCSYDNYASPYGDDCVQFGGFYRCWDIFIPEELSGDVPLVIDMHGFTADPKGQRDVSGFEELAKSEGFIVVWPYGLCNSWNSGLKCCGAAVQDNIDDVEFIREMVEHLSFRYNIDLGRVYATGLSNGCSMAFRLANEASDLIAAVACMSQYMLVPPEPDYTPVSMMEIHGTADWACAYQPDFFQGAIENFNSLMEMNGCFGDYTEKRLSDFGYSWTYTNCDNSTEISLVTIEGGGHVLYRGAETELNTTRIAWEFMKRFSK
jgi:polyhydroxybutyrate depolymerase